jgi:hypothetical protein
MAGLLERLAMDRGCDYLACEQRNEQGDCAGCDDEEAVSEGRAALARWREKR